MISCIKTEIIELHQFFQDWYNNRLPLTNQNFARCAEVLSPDFMIIFPNGEMVTYQPLLQRLRQAHNSFDGIQILIENIQVRQQLGDLFLATYEERHILEGKTSTRLSSVLFKKDPFTPNGLQWLHVHETWIKS